jgi:hypothetical protein
MDTYELPGELTEAIQTDRRQAARAAASYPVTIYDRRGYLLGRGRTVDISQAGVFVVAIPIRRATYFDRILVEIDLSRPSDRRGGTSGGKVVRYLARVIRRERLAQMEGLGLQILGKADSE